MSWWHYPKTRTLSVAVLFYVAGNFVAFCVYSNHLMNFFKLHLFNSFLDSYLHMWYRQTLKDANTHLIIYFTLLRHQYLYTNMLVKWLWFSFWWDWCSYLIKPFVTMIRVSSLISWTKLIAGSKLLFNISFW